MDFRKDTDFLADDSFIEWRLFPTEESDAYWNDFRNNNLHLEDALDSAIAKFSTVRINDHKLSKEEIDRLYRRILHTWTSRLRRKKIARFSAAAAFAALAVLSAFSIRYFSPSSLPVTAETIIGQELPPEQIRLISGKNVIVVENHSEINMSDAGMELVMESANDEEVLNTLIVPRGKVSSLVFSDGSKVWVNSGTEITFPAKFTGPERRISVNGEIYIDVKKDDLHPFFVQTSEFGIRVHGTKFNVSSYADSPAKFVALEEGKVEISMGGKSRYLKPSELFATENGVTKISSVDVAQYTSWKDGFLILDKAPISQIFEKVGRYYNVEFKQSESGLLNRTVSGKLILSDNIQSIMQVIGSIAGITYERSGDTLYINNKE